MPDATYATISYDTHDGLLQKLYKLGSWALGTAAFLTVGWMSLRPDDPLGAISMINRANALGVMLQAAALAAVVAALATLLAGRIRADAGTFAAVLGLAAVSLRGGTTTLLLVDHAEGSATHVRVLAAKLALESVAWFVVVLIAMMTAALVARWCLADFDSDKKRSRGHRHSPLMAAYDIPFIGARFFGVSASLRTESREGLKHVAIVAVVGICLLNLLAEELVSRAIRHGQACFVVAASVYLACYVAHYVTNVRSALWSILAVPLIALGGYAWAGVQPAAHGLPATVSPSPFLCILPIQYVAVGTAAALAVFWQVTHSSEIDPNDTRFAAKGDAVRERA